MSNASLTVSVCVPTGMLGAGIWPAQVDWAIKRGAAAVAIDAGSTDSGPSCLATGISKLSRDAIKRDLKATMQVAVPAGVPILIGTCGTAGTDMGVDWTRDIVVEIARELGQHPKIALIYSEQDKDRLKAKMADGAIAALPPAGPMTGELIDSCAHIVALLGPEPFQDALRAGADIVLGGRTTDTAVIAAVPLMRGADPGPTWHAAKTAECGGLCTVNPREGGVMITVGQGYFDVEPLNEGNTCSPRSVSAHMLYENSDPFRLVEPGGILNAAAATYAQHDERTTRVSGSVWEPQPYTMKLEGARSGSFQTFLIVGIEDPMVLANLDEFTAGMEARLNQVVAETFPGETGWHLSLRAYGWNAVSGRPVAPGFVPREIGLMLVCTARTQDMATRIAKTANPIFFHFPLKRGIPLPTYAFPFSPGEVERGAVHEFVLNHVVRVDHPSELTRTVMVDLARSEVEHAQA